MELKKDERRPLNEPAQSAALYAPHAPKCDVGLSVQEWAPGVTLGAAMIFDCIIH